MMAEDDGTSSSAGSSDSDDGDWLGKIAVLTEENSTLFLYTAPRFGW